jgi:hypothetical protein
MHSPKEGPGDLGCLKEKRTRLVRGLRLMMWKAPHLEFQLTCMYGMFLKEFITENLIDLNMGSLVLPFNTMQQNKVGTQFPN